MTCSDCQTDNPPVANYCLGCGSLLGASPPVHDSAPAAGPPGRSDITRAVRRHVSGEFAKKLAASDGRIVSERRIVTILFADVCSSTALAENLDPEEVLEIMNGAFEAMIEPVRLYEGTVARLMGDAILAFFGAPVAHEDDAERACRSALEILRRIRTYAGTLERERGIRDFNVRVGINTGLVVVGEVGTEVRAEYTAMGDAVNLAARMESTAEHGTVRITDQTLNLVRHVFEATPVGNVSVKGKAHPVSAYRLVAVKKSARAAVQSERRYPLVGRETESRLLGGLIHTLGKGKSAAIAVTGEAGIGKSRLAAEHRGHLPSSVSWVEVRVAPYATRMSYSLAGRLICSLAGMDPDSPGDALGAGLDHVISRWCPAQRDTVRPFLRSLLHLPIEEVTAERIGKLDGESYIGGLIRSLHILLEAKSTASPLVLCLEDFQWADHSSLSLLDTLLPMTRTLPVLILLVSRPEKDAILRVIETLSESFEGDFHLVELGPLGRTDCTKLVDNMLGEHSLPDRTLSKILDGTGGNAFFLEEVVRSLFDGTDVPGANPDSESDDSISRLSVPDTVQGVITARLDRLGNCPHRLLEIGSVIGRTFDEKLLKGVMAHEGQGEGLEGALVELVERGFLLPRPRASSRAGGVANDREFAFRQGVTRDVIYGNILLARRKVIHRLVGESIEASRPGGDVSIAPILALHFDRAGETSRALDYSVRTADHARFSFATQEAVLHYTRALELARSIGVKKTQLEFIQESLGDVLSMMARYDAAIKHFQAALDCTTLRLARAILRRKIAQVYEKWGRYEPAELAFGEALSELEQCSDPAETARIRIGLAGLSLRRGDPAPALRWAEDALDRLDRENDVVGVAHACNLLGSVRARQGDLPGAVGYFHRCLKTWHDLGDTNGLAATLNNLGQVYHRSENWTRAERYYRESLELSERTGNRYGRARTCDNLSQVFAAQGRHDEATEYLKTAVGIFSDIGKVDTGVVPGMWVHSGTL